jgi:hypothetical protein
MLAASVEKLLFHQDQLLLRRHVVTPPLIGDFNSSDGVLKVQKHDLAIFLSMLLGIFGYTAGSSNIFIIGQFIFSLTGSCCLGIAPIFKLRNRIFYHNILFTVFLLVPLSLGFLLLNVLLYVKSSFGRSIAHLKVCRLQSKLLFVSLGRHSLIILDLVQQLKLIHHLKSRMILLISLRHTGFLLCLA